MHLFPPRGQNLLTSSSFSSSGWNISSTIGRIAMKITSNIHVNNRFVRYFGVAKFQYEPNHIFFHKYWENINLSYLFSIYFRLCVISVNWQIFCSDIPGYQKTNRRLTFPFVCVLDWNVSATIGWITMNFDVFMIFLSTLNLPCTVFIFHTLRSHRAARVAVDSFVDYCFFFSCTLWLPPRYFLKLLFLSSHHLPLYLLSSYTPPLPHLLSSS